MGLGKTYSIIFLLTLFGFGIISFSTTSFAEPSAIIISIPSGTSSIGCEETNECFIPATVTVDVGERVTWTFDDSTAHSVTSGLSNDVDSIGMLFDSGLLMQDSTFSHIFNEVGTIDYFCVVHPWMQGIVIVQETSIGKKEDIDDTQDYIEKEKKITIEFDYDEYIIEDGAFITLFDSSENLNSIKKDMINVKISSETSQGFMIKLTETSPNSGIFVNKKLLKFTTGPTSEVDQELNVDIDNGNIVTVVHKKSSDTANVFEPGIAGVQASEDNHVTFNYNFYEIDSGISSISIFDPDRNTDPNKIQRFDVTLDVMNPSLNTIKESMTIRMLEKSVDSGDFRSKYFIHFTSGTSDPATYYIHAEEGDTARVTHQSITYGETEFATAAITDTPFGEPPSSTINVDTTEALTCPDGDDPQDGICAAWMPISPIEGLDIPVNSVSYTRSCTPLLVDTSGEYVDLGTGYTTNIVCPSPNTLDVFVEIDYMTGHKPSQQAIEDVIEIFQMAPQTINLHVTVDEDIGFKERIRFFTQENPTPGSAPSYFELKDAYFGTFEERQSPNVGDVLTAKRQTFHYGMFVHKYVECTNCSGYADTANDFIVSLGAWAGADPNGDGGIGSIRQQSGTFLHELGHNFALIHGGDQNINCKPNYLSTMSYTYQFPEFGLDLLDYSRSKLPTLNELNLDENDGVGESDPSGMSIVIGDDVLMPEIVSTGIPINWNNQGDSTDTGVSRNINYLSGMPGCDKNVVDSNMGGYDDWVNLQFVSRAQPHFSDGIAFSPESLPEILPTSSQQAKTAAPDVDRETPNAKPQNIMISKLENIPITLVGSAPFGKNIKTFEIISMPSGGTVAPPTINDDQNIAQTTFIPNQNFDRKDSFDFVVTTEVNGQTIRSNPSTVNIIFNSPPIANSQTITTFNNIELQIELDGFDLDGDTLEFFADDQESSGSLDSIIFISPTTSQVTYVPDSRFVGTDIFEFKATDGLSGSNIAIVTLNVQSPVQQEEGAMTDESTDAENGQPSESEVEQATWPNESTITWILIVIAFVIIGIIWLFLQRS